MSTVCPVFLLPSINSHVQLSLRPSKFPAKVFPTSRHHPLPPAADTEFTHAPQISSSPSRPSSASARTWSVFQLPNPHCCRAQQGLHVPRAHIPRILGSKMCYSHQAQRRMAHNVHNPSTGPAMALGSSSSSPSWRSLSRTRVVTREAYSKLSVERSCFARPPIGQARKRHDSVPLLHDVT
jgi:hypothetical protein